MKKIILRLPRAFFTTNHFHATRNLQYIARSLPSIFFQFVFFYVSMARLRDAGGLVLLNVRQGFHLISTTTL